MIKYLEFLNRKVIRNLFKEATCLNASVWHLGCARCSIIVFRTRKALAIKQEAAENQIFAWVVKFLKGLVGSHRKSFTSPFIFSPITGWSSKLSLKVGRSRNRALQNIRIWREMVKVLEGWAEPRWSPVAWRHRRPPGGKTAKQPPQRNTRAAILEHMTGHLRGVQDSDARGRFCLVNWIGYKGSIQINWLWPMLREIDCRPPMI